MTLSTVFFKNILNSILSLLIKRDTILFNFDYCGLKQTIVVNLHAGEAAVPSKNV